VAATEGHRGRRRIPVRDPALLRPVLECIAAGMSGREIAAKLHLSHDGVKARVRGLYAALGVRNAAHAVAKAYATGWASPAQPPAAKLAAPMPDGAPRPSRRQAPPRVSR